ncbi:MAG: hypothetical protein K0U16_07270 [Gammaproteobacteria bacterium]|nr:hypothetical protein [Gammaproteobacteria bacterium]
MALRNPAWNVVFAVGAVAAGAGALALGYRALARSFNELEGSQQPDLDLEAVMPTLADFPQGWSVVEAGIYESNPGPSSSAPAYRFEWRILRLPSPSTMCTPPCSFVAVWTAQNAYERRTSGWVPTYSVDDAIDLLGEKHDEVG